MVAVALIIISKLLITETIQITSLREICQWIIKVQTFLHKENTEFPSKKQKKFFLIKGGFKIKLHTKIGFETFV